MEHLWHDTERGAESGHGGVPAVLFLQPYLAADVDNRGDVGVQDFQAGGSGKQRCSR